jgi:pimeloyl-ACP methyl ester carboxylesterase
MPHDIHAFVAAAPFLAQRCYRVIAAYLRGYGATGGARRKRFMANALPEPDLKYRSSAWAVSFEPTAT